MWPPTQWPSQQLWDDGRLQEEATPITGSIEIPAISLLGAELLLLPKNLWIFAIFGSSGKIHSMEAKQMASAHLSANPYLVTGLYLAQLRALLFITDVNSLEKFWAFVPLAPYQSWKVPRLLQPDNAPGATHIISSLCGTSFFHCFTHHGKNCQVYVGHPSKALRFRDPTAKWIGIRRSHITKLGCRTCCRWLMILHKEGQHQQMGSNKPGCWTPNNCLNVGDGAPTVTQLESQSHFHSQNHHTLYWVGGLQSLCSQLAGAMMEKTRNWAKTTLI